MLSGGNGEADDRGLAAVGNPVWGSVVPTETHMECVAQFLGCQPQADNECDTKNVPLGFS